MQLIGESQPKCLKKLPSLLSKLVSENLLQAKSMSQMLQTDNQAEINRRNNLADSTVVRVLFLYYNFLFELISNF